MIAFDDTWIKQYFPSYSYHSTLDSGGQKDVCIVKSHTGIDCILKIVNPDVDTERIKREIETVQKHSFSHVPVIYATGEITFAGKNLIYIIEQRIDGQNLRSHIVQSAMAHTTVQKIVYQLLIIVSELESNGVVHRDIKPENVLMDKSGDIWLIDFGIALDFSKTALTAPSAKYAMCTLGYAAPEQIRNLKTEISSKSDLFAIGIMAYELLTQQHPLRDNAHGQLDILYKTENTQLPPVPPKFNTPSDFDQFIHWLAERLPSRRPETAMAALMYFEQNFLGDKS